MWTSGPWHPPRIQAELQAAQFRRGQPLHMSKVQEEHGPHASQWQRHSSSYAAEVDRARHLGSLARVGQEAPSDLQEALQRRRATRLAASSAALDGAAAAGTAMLKLRGMHMPSGSVSASIGQSGTT